MMTTPLNPVAPHPLRCMTCICSLDDCAEENEGRGHVAAANRKKGSGGQGRRALRCR